MSSFYLLSLFLSGSQRIGFFLLIESNFCVQVCLTMPVGGYSRVAALPLSPSLAHVLCVAVLAPRPPRQISLSGCLAATLPWSGLALTSHHRPLHWRLGSHRYGVFVTGARQERLPDSRRRKARRADGRPDGPANTEAARPRAAP